MGHAALQHLINIHFTSPSLGSALLAAGRPAMIYFVAGGGSSVVGAVVAHDLQHGEFVAQVRVGSGRGGRGPHKQSEETQCPAGLHSAQQGWGNLSQASVVSPRSETVAVSRTAS